MDSRFNKEYYLQSVEIIRIEMQNTLIIQATYSNGIFIKTEAFKVGTDIPSIIYEDETL